LAIIAILERELAVSFLLDRFVSLVEVFASIAKKSAWNVLVIRLDATDGAEELQVPGGKHEVRA